MSYETLPYDQWIEEALRGVIRRAIQQTAEHGLPGAHHFYVTFRTDAEGVEMASDLRARHPEEMTIVLQHQFSGLEVDDESFVVELKFHGKPYRLRVPLGAISAFGDPSVNFGLQLKRIVVGADGETNEGDEATADGGSSAAGPSAKDGVNGESGKTETGEVVTLDNFRKK